MEIIGVNENEVFEIINNFKYFNNQLEQIKNPIGLMEIVMGNYSRERSVVEKLKGMKKILQIHDGNEELARAYCHPTVGEMLADLIESMDQRKPSIYPFNCNDFDFWLTIYKKINDKQHI